MVLLRVEKPGVGDSEGPDCQDASLEDDLAAFRAALQRLRELPGVDPQRLVIMGGSIGGGLAPILAAEAPAGVVAVVSLAGFGKTWYEHMLELERRRLALLGAAAGDINDAMRGYARFYTEYLVGRKTPAEVLREYPALTALWYDEPERQYGRAARYYHEVQTLNVERAWAALDVDALIVWGTYDWIMSRDDQESVVRIVNAKHPGRATLLVLDGTDHGLMRYPSAVAAFRDESAQFDDALPARVIAWLRAHVGTSR
jgi:pimeloyl-ACP methyl ester carboxylesterase